MKKLLFAAALGFVSHCSFAQDYVFMHLLENKLLCKEDRLVNFLETNSYVREHRTFHRHFSYNAEPYFTEIIVENDCYATYRTNSKREYRAIEKQVQELCSKEIGASNHVYYACNNRRMYGAQVELPGFSPSDNAWEVRIYQNPGWDEINYPASKK